MDAAGTKRLCLRCKPITRVVFAYVIRINYKGCATRVSFYILFRTYFSLYYSCARRVSWSSRFRAETRAYTTHGGGGGGTFPAIFSGDIERVQLLRGP